MSLIGGHNIDEWIFNSLEGNLSLEDQRILQDFLIEHPDYLEDYMAWENSFVNRSDVHYPAMDQLLADKAFYETGWFKWSTGVLCGILLSFGSMQVSDFVQGNKNAAKQKSPDSTVAPATYTNNPQAYLKEGRGKRSNQLASTSTTNPNQGIGEFEGLNGSDALQDEAQSQRAFAKTKNSQTNTSQAERDQRTTAVRGRSMAAASGGSEDRPNRVNTALPGQAGEEERSSRQQMRDEKMKAKGYLSIENRTKLAALQDQKRKANQRFQDESSNTQQAEYAFDREEELRDENLAAGHGPVREQNELVDATPKPESTYVSPDGSDYEPGWLETYWREARVAHSARNSESSRKPKIHADDVKEVMNPFGRRVAYMEPVLYGPHNGPIAQNAAFAGSVRKSRLTLNYRNEWAKQDEIGAKSYTIAYDNYIRKLGGGLSVQLMHDETGNGLLRMDDFSVSYSPKFQGNNGISFEPAVRLGVYQRSFNANKLVAGTPNRDLRTGFSFGSSEAAESVTVLNPNLGAGFLIQSNRFYVSIASDHLLQPEESFSDRSFTRVRSYQAHAGTVVRPLYWLDWTPALHYYRPAGNSALVVSSTFAVSNLFAGVALVDGNDYQLTAGVNSRLFRISYSYDSGAHPRAFNTDVNQLNSHEVSLRFFFDELTNRKQTQVYSGGVRRE